MTLNYLPGIPAAGTADATSFSISFWAGLYSGFIYSIFTGIIVGLAVWLVQISVEKRRTRNEFERELAVFKERIKFDVVKEDVINIQDAKKSAPLSAVALADLFQDYPIDLWMENLPQRKSFLQILKKFQHSFFEFNIIAEKLDSNLENFVRNYNASKNIIRTNDQFDIIFFIGKLHNFDPVRITSWLDRPITALSRFEESYNAITGEQDIIKLSNKYLERRKEILSAIEDIKKHLDDA